MTKELVISSNRHETKVAILEDDQLVEVYFQRAHEYSLVGSIHKGRVTRVLPGMQSAFVNLGLERDAFLYVSDFVEQTGEDYDRVSHDDRPRRNGRSDRGGRGERGERSERGERGERGQEPRQAPVATVSAAAAPPALDIPGAELDSSAAPPPPAGQEKRDGRENRDRDDRGRRGRRSRRRRTNGGGFPDSKYAQPGELSGQPAGEEQDDGEQTEPADALVLPGESIAKYSHREPAAAGGAKSGLAPEAEPELEVDISLVAETPGETAPGALTDELKEEVNQLVEELEEEAALDAAQEAAEAALAAEQETTVQLPEPRVSWVELVAASGEPDGQSSETGEAAVSYFEEGIAEVSHADEIERSVEDETGGIADPEVSGETGGDEPAVDRESADVSAEGETVAEGGEAALSAEVREEPAAARYIQRGARRVRRRGDRERDTRERDNRDRDRDRDNRESRESRGDGEWPEAAESRPVSRPEREKPPMPSISELLKEGQEVIVQIFKEPLGQKGARITSHLAMPGRYVVYMPTLDHLGVSRKVASDEERARLKRIVQTHAAGMTGGFIVRTAGEGKPEADIAADMTYLYEQWLDIRKRAEKRPAPALLHHDLELVMRILRDQLNDQFKAIWVDNEDYYEQVVSFLERFQPALVNRVRLYTRDTPIFDTFNITAELEKALRPKVWLKSGGYIVVNQTEALVAVDINTGKFVGKSNRLEDTIVKTNLEAVKEIVRQIRLRDLGGIIVIDFIDMEERRNRQKVMQALEEAMRTDRAPYKILQFNDFGLVAITRRRVKQSLERALCQACPTCEGAGYVKSVQTVVGEILTEAYKIAPALEGKDVMLRVHPDVARELKKSGENYIAEMEEILGRTLIVKSDALLHPEKFDLA